MLSNKEIKWITSLKNKKYRHIHRAFIAEGPKLVNDLLINGLQPIKILKITSYKFSNDRFLEKVVDVDVSTLKKLSSLQTPNKVLAVFEMVEEQPKEQHEKDTWGIALDFIQDPGNFGTIIRTMDYLGITQIYCSDDSVDVYNSKVIQATMGAIGRVNIQYVEMERFLKQQVVPVYLTDMSGESIEKKQLEPGIIVFGNEGNGIRNEVKALNFQKIAIPKIGKGESLNLAISAAIIGAWVTLKQP